MIWMLEVPSASYPGRTFFINPAAIAKIVGENNSCKVSFMGDNCSDENVTSTSAIVGMSDKELATLINKEYALIKAMEAAAK